MKGLLGYALLLSFAITAAFAISGGPPYPVGTNLVGSYAGVLKPNPCGSPFATPTPASSPSPTPADLAANSIGIFTAGIPSVGLTTGTFVLFAEGKVYSGTLQGVADPVHATVRGVLHANELLTSTQSATPGSNVEGAEQANGNFNSRVVTTAASSFTVAGIRMRGTAALYISPGEAPSQINSEICMRVNGLKQSNSEPIAVAAPSP